MIASVNGPRDEVIQRIRDLEPTLLFTCTGCGWVRWIVTGEKEREERVYSPVYGNVSLRLLAQLDIKNHQCKYAAEAKRRAKRGRAIARTYLRNSNVARASSRFSGAL